MAVVEDGPGWATVSVPVESAVFAYVIGAARRSACAGASNPMAINVDPVSAIPSARDTDVFISYLFLRSQPFQAVRAFSSSSTKRLFTITSCTPGERKQKLGSFDRKI